MLELYKVPRIEDEISILQLDGAPPQHSESVRDFLDYKFLQSWIGRGG